MPDPLCRVFILGAGFSQAAGLPLSSDLLDLVLREIGALNDGDSHLHRALGDYVDYVEATTGTAPDPVDIEDFAAYLDHQHSFGMLGSDTWSEEGNRDQYLLRWGIGRVLHRRTPRSDSIPALYLEFAAGLRPKDVVLTFNYDTLLESALRAVGMPFRRFPDRFSEVGPALSTIDNDREAHEVLILKVHGSLDWVNRSPYERKLEYMLACGGKEMVDFAARRDRLFGPQSCTRLHRLVEGPRPDDDELEDLWVIDDLDAYYSDFLTAFYHPPILLPPSSTKHLYGGSLRSFWNGLPLFGWAHGALVVIGYSFPKADSYARQAFFRLASDYCYGLDNPGYRIFPMDKIVIIDKRMDSYARQELLDSYRFLDPVHTDFYLEGFGPKCLERLFFSAPYRPRSVHSSG